MAVLKRFSYDNIVEHNPTAPDPVEGGGGGDQSIIFGGVYRATFSGVIAGRLSSLSMNVTAMSPITQQTPEGYVSVAVAQYVSMSSLGDRYAGYQIGMDDTNTVFASVNISPREETADVSETAPLSIVFGIFYVKVN